MTYEEAAAILGPELTAQAEAIAATAPPLSDAQIDLLVPLLDPTPPAAAARDVA